VGLISVRESAHLKATIIALQAVPKDVNLAIRTETRTVGRAAWRDELLKQSATVQQSRMLVETARVAVSGQSVTLTSASSRRKVLSGGATPAGAGKAFEFGSKYGHGIPPVRRGGYVVYPALADVAPRIISSWVQTTMRLAYDAMEGKR